MCVQCFSLSRLMNKCTSQPGSNQQSNPTRKIRDKEIVVRQGLGLFVVSGTISNDQLFMPGYSALQNKCLHSQQPICLEESISFCAYKHQP